MEDLIKAAKALITYIEEENVYDTSDDDGDGYTDYSQSQAFQDLVSNLEHTIKDAAPITNAVKAIKEGLIAIVQTGIARQTQPTPSGRRRIV